MLRNWQLKFKLARRLLGKSSSGRFAPAVAIISTLGITIGICALIVVSSVMTGLEGRLKDVVLSAAPHLIVKTDMSIAPKLEDLKNLAGLCPEVEARALAQSPTGISPLTLEGLDIKNAVIYDQSLRLPAVPENGTYHLALSIALLDALKLNFEDKVRIISTVNARYTMMGLTPSARLFTITDYIRQASNSSDLRALGAYEDVLRVLRATDEQLGVRVFLKDPYQLEEISSRLRDLGVSFKTWQDSEGEFFAAVHMEKIAMGVMLFLIVMVAAFNLLSSLTMMVGSRLEEIAILKTLGMKSRGIIAIFFIMGLICAGTGIISGSILGIILSLKANELMQLLGISVAGSSRIPVIIDYGNIALIAILTLLLAVLSTALPALRAGRVEVSATLEHQ